MKEKKEKKLRLNKITIQDFDSVLDGDQQNAIKGGSDIQTAGTTDIPVICKP
ncbi:MAG: hypothetical protein JSV88_04180 [Candidatus Aminicenantes bacterium]|nr:MAG: hypothetical protein JSV88_04180 [Candidatus Aminicenantes bacterium]